MIKKFSLIIAWLLTAGIFGVSAQNVSVNVDMPASAAPGSTFRVTLKVNKGDISGFAKLEQNLPSGLSASSVDVANSTFSFKDQKVKFLWMSLPAEANFSVSYDVKVADGTSGNQIFEGSFAYIHNNETQKYIIPKSIINISVQQVASNEVKVNTVETPYLNADAEKAKADADRAAKEAADKAAREAADRAAREAADKAAKEAADKAAKDAAAAEKANRELAEQIKKKQEEERKAQEALQKKQLAQATNTQPVAIPKAQPAAPIKEGKPVEGLVFRAQVAAGKKKVSPTVFNKQFNLNEEIFWEEHDGWQKYTVGNFSSYRAAKTFANDIRDNNGVEGSFVVAYHNGNRISVQEALNLSGGK